MFCIRSKSLYNRTCYLILQHLNYTEKLIGDFQLMNVLRSEPVYTELPAHTSQQIIKAVRAAWRAYLQASKKFKNDPSGFLGKPRAPKYKPYNGQYSLFFTKDQLRVKGTVLHFPARFGLRVDIGSLSAIPLQMARIVPKGVGYCLELIYHREVPDQASSEEEIIESANNIVAVDIGVNNLLAWTNNIDDNACVRPLQAPSIIVNGGVVKSKNQYFNKERARLRSQYDRQGIKSGPKLEMLKEKRANQMHYLMHKASRLLIDWCSKHDIDTIVIGYNEGWKQEVNMGNVSNQNFVSIPFAKLVKMVQYKAIDCGIRVIFTEESYTSKCSFLDNEPLERREYYVGRRTHRGLFVSAEGLEVNADINGSANSGRKVFPMRFSYGTVDVVRHPSRLELHPVTGTQGRLVTEELAACC